MNRNLKMRVLAPLMLVLPLAGCKESGPSFPTADLIISPTGTLMLDGRPVAEKDLLQELKAVHERAPDITVYVRHDSTQPGDPQVLTAIYAASKEAGVGINVTIYKEQEEAMRWKGRLEDLAFCGSMVLVAILASMRFALKADTPAAAMRREFRGVIIKSLIIAALVGLFLDIRDRNTAGAWNVRFAVMPIFVVPYAVVGAVLAGGVCALRVHYRRPPSR